MLCASGAYGWRISDQISSSGQQTTFALAVAGAAYRITGAVSSSIDQFALMAMSGGYAIIGAASVTDPDVITPPSPPRSIAPARGAYALIGLGATVVSSIGLVFRHNKRK